MNNYTDYKQFTILGDGIESHSIKAFLIKHVPHAEIRIVPQINESNYQEIMNSISDESLILKSPGIPPRFVTKPYTTGTNIFFQEARARGWNIIAITGTKGKSTTASLTCAMLKAHQIDAVLAGNIGIAAVDLLDRPDYLGKALTVVLELSSYQLFDLAYSPDTACIINLYNDHADWHEGEENYHNAKLNLVKRKETDIHSEKKLFFVYNANFPKLQKASEQSHIIPCPIDTDSFSHHEIPAHIIGEHNKLNVEAAFAVASHYGVTKAEALEALTTFKPLPHRLELVGTFHDIDFYDDAISTTPESTIAGIEALTKMKSISTIFLGGTDRGYDFTSLVTTLKKYHIENIVLFPPSGSRIFELINEYTDADFVPHIFETTDMTAAVAFAFENSKEGTACLLSTASPSYSLWKNFEEKGNEFKRAIQAYQREV
ncbi:MAG: hypothetical protein RLY57_153 [Candidatus Parcubacteria bacterium]|jgi:UDP-N-acetylmuramoylalanine--D-glutamate ligase